jgi:arylsulfatase A-like enzyme
MNFLDTRSNKRSWMVLAGLLLAVCFPAAQAGDSPKMNVLFLAIDDLRPELGAYGADYMHTPAIDRLAAEGVAFRRAYSNVPVCGASRASMLTGLRPTRGRFLTYYTRIDEDAPDIPTLPGWFRQAGYTTVSLGKVAHHRNDSPSSWSEPAWGPENQSVPGYRGWRNYLEVENIREDMLKDEGHPPAWEAPDVDDDAYFDGRVARRAVELLRQFEQDDTPFFMALGFVKPHLPFNAPERYWDKYALKSVELPANRLFPEKAPRQAWHNWGELRKYKGIPGGDEAVPDEMALKLIQGYRAATSYADAQVKLVLDELDRLGLAENTIVVLWGDHGWSLGEHGLWAKHSPFNLANRIPLIVRAPGVAKGVADGLVESVDIYPTVVELAGLPAPDHLQGDSFMAALEDPGAALKEAVFPRWQNSDSIRTDRHYYTEWRDEQGQVTARMLYDHSIDPGELNNVAEDPAYALVVNELSLALAGHIAETAQE